MSAINGLALVITIVTFGPLYAALIMIARRPAERPAQASRVGRLGEDAP